MEYIALIPAGVVAILWYLIRQKDEKVAKDIQTLFELRRIDEDKLAAFRLLLATDHYSKQELDQRFLRLEQAISGGLTKLEDGLGNKFDKFSVSLLEYITHGKGN